MWWRKVGRIYCFSQLCGIVGGGGVCGGNGWSFASSALGRVFISAGVNIWPEPEQYLHTIPLNTEPNGWTRRRIDGHRITHMPDFRHIARIEFLHRTRDIPAGCSSSSLFLWQVISKVDGGLCLQVNDRRLPEGRGRLRKARRRKREGNMQVYLE
ncbi:hypothetical protein V8F33_004069 [Rhypophila sp. PSN 637]